MKLTFNLFGKLFLIIAIITSCKKEYKEEYVKENLDPNHLEGVYKYADNDGDTYMLVKKGISKKDTIYYIKFYYIYDTKNPEYDENKRQYLRKNEQYMFFTKNDKSEFISNNGKSIIYTINSKNNLYEYNPYNLQNDDYGYYYLVYPNRINNIKVTYDNNFNTNYIKYLKIKTDKFNSILDTMKVN